MFKSASTMSGAVAPQAFDRLRAVSDGDDIQALVRERQLDHALDRDAVVGQQQLLSHTDGA